MESLKPVSQMSHIIGITKVSVFVPALGAIGYWSGIIDKIDDLTLYRSGAANQPPS